MQSFDENSAYENVFTDVDGSAWYAKYVNFMHEKNLIGGYGDGTFRPDSTITRAEAVTMLNKAIGRDADSIQTAYPNNPFSDLSPSHWAYNQILEAAVQEY